MKLEEQYTTYSIIVVPYGDNLTQIVSMSSVFMQDNWIVCPTETQMIANIAMNIFYSLLQEFDLKIKLPLVKFL